jgi:hypothetical protein
MLLEQLYYLGELFGVVIVAGSLIFVGLQMRQNANALRVSTTAASVGNWQSTVLELSSSDHLVPAYARVSQAAKATDLTFEDIARIAAFSSAVAKNAEFAYYRHRANEIDDGFWDVALNTLIGFFNTSMMREAIWPRVKIQLSPDFTSRVEDAFSQEPL